jgi:ribonuclease J
MLVPVDEALKMRPEEVVIMCTGSQGEPTSIMGRLSTGTNRQFDIIPGDTVVLSSHPIPGNEESVFRTINRLFRRGANVIYTPIAPVHVSGHASQEEIKLLLHLVKPKYLVPIHGELRHLRQHETLAREVGVPAENIARGRERAGTGAAKRRAAPGRAHPGRVRLCGRLRGGRRGPSVMREREALARDGIVLVNLLVDKQSGRLLDEPEVLTRGFVHTQDANKLLAEARQKIAEVASRANGNLEDDLQQMLKSFLYNETKRRPTIFVTLSRS